MATIFTHAVAGLGIARLGMARPMPWSYWGLAALLPILPDFDVYSTAAYGDALGHRGITHSLAFALVVGTLAAGVTFRHFRAKWWRLGLLFFAIIASHGLLDALTKGGFEIPFFWPLGGRWGDWGPIPASDLRIDLSDLGQSQSLRAEFLWVWLPTGLVVGLVTLWRRLRPSHKTEDSTG
jgi:inner membrane protein